MCGRPDHIHDTYSQYDPTTGVMRFIQKCVACVWSKVVHQEEYSPGFTPSGSVRYMDDTALLAHCEANIARRNRPKAKLPRLPDQAVRRAA